MILRKKDVLKEISSELEVDNTRWYQHLPSEKISAWRKVQERNLWQWFAGKYRALYAMLLCMKMMDEFGLRNERLKLIVSDNINGGLETMTFNPFTLASHTADIVHIRILL